MSRKPLFVLPLTVVATAANAADIAPPPPPVPQAIIDELTHFHIEGGPVFSSARITTQDPPDKFGVIPSDRGFYVGAALRHLSTPHWGWQIAATATWMREVTLTTPDAILISNLRFQTFDIDAGFHPTSDLHQRLFFGLRVLHSTDSLSLEIPFDFSESTGEMWLFGPRAGIAWQTPIGASSVAFVAEFSVAALFGHADVFFDMPFDTVDMSGNRAAFNAEGQVGFLVTPGDDFEITFGYRVQQWWGLRQATEVDTFVTEAFVDTNKLIHGPFARVGIDF